MKKTYSKPRLKTEAFTPQEAITACWISTWECDQQFHTNYLYNSHNPGQNSYPLTSNLHNHTCKAIKVVINTEGDAEPTVTPLSQFMSQMGVFAAQQYPKSKHNGNENYWNGYAWNTDGTYHFSSSSPHSWEKNQS